MAAASESKSSLELNDVYFSRFKATLAKAHTPIFTVWFRRPTGREKNERNLIKKAFTAVELKDEEVASLHEILADMQRDWKHKQKELQQRITLHVSQLEHKLERLTDAYLERAIDRDTFEKRKGELLVQIREQEIQAGKISTQKALLFKKAEKFLERVKSLKKSFEIQNTAFRRKLLKSVTSNLSTTGKNLMIAMKSPFHELANRAFCEFGALARNRTWILTSAKLCPIR